jgi:hypothetical protein
VYLTNISHHIISYHITSHHITSHHITSQLVHYTNGRHHTILYYQITIYCTNSSHHVILYELITSHYTILTYLITTQHYTTLRSKHLKLQCIAMKDDGKSTDEIMRALNITKGHVEKWYSPKVTNDSLSQSLTLLLLH